MKWGHGCKIWDWSIILHYFVEYLTIMLTLGFHSYKSSNLVLDLKMWENFESNLSVCSPRSLIRTTTSRKRMMHFWRLLNNGRKVLFLVEYQVKRFEGQKETDKTKNQFRWSQVWSPGSLFQDLSFEQQKGRGQCTFVLFLAACHRQQQL